MKKRGYLTIALGQKRFYQEAECLAKTYYINGWGKPSEKLPFCVITDKDGKYLEEFFDDIVIVEENAWKGFLFKLKIYKYSPYEETIYIDADSLIICDIGFFWNMFVSVQSEVSAFGYDIPLTNKASSWLYTGKYIKEKFNIDKIPGFNGGVIYWRKGEKSKEVFEYAIQLSKYYQELKIKKVARGISDEPLLSISMAVHGMKTYHDMGCVCMLTVLNMKKLKLNVLRKICMFEKGITFVRPAVFHAAGGYTNSWRYRIERQKINVYYKYIKNKFYKKESKL